MSGNYDTNPYNPKVHNYGGHLVGELTLGKSERCFQILFQSCPLRMLLDGSQNLSVNSGLVRLSLLGRFVFLLLGVKDLTILPGSLLCLDPGKIFVVDVVRNLDSRNVNLGGCSQQEPLVDPSQRSSIQLEWSSHQEEAGLQLLQDHHALPFVNSGQDDGHGSSRQRRPHGPLVLREEVDGGSLGGRGNGGVVVSQLLHADHAGASIFGSSDLLLNEDLLLCSSGLRSDLLGELVDGLLVVGGTLAEPVNSTVQGIVTRLARVFVLGHTSLVEVNQAIL